MWDLKCDRKELSYKAETDSETQKTNLRFPRGRGKGQLGDGFMHIHRLNKQHLRK